MPVDSESAVVETTHEENPVAMEACPDQVQQCVEIAEDVNGKVAGKFLVGCLYQIKF